MTKGPKDGQDRTYLNLAIKQIVRACMMPSVLPLRSSTVTFTRMSHGM